MVRVQRSALYVRVYEFFRGYRLLVNSCSQDEKGYIDKTRSSGTGIRSGNSSVVTICSRDLYLVLPH